MRDKEMRRGQRSRKQHTRRDGEMRRRAESSLQVEANKERWRDEQEAESSLQGRLVASKQRLTDDEGAEELTSRDGEMRRGRRAACMRDLRQARRDGKINVAIAKKIRPVVIIILSVRHRMSQYSINISSVFSYLDCFVLKN